VFDLKGEAVSHSNHPWQQVIDGKGHGAFVATANLNITCMATIFWAQNTRIFIVYALFISKGKAPTHTNHPEHAWQPRS
jgi:hypothetical protein